MTECPAYMGFPGRLTLFEYYFLSLAKPEAERGVPASFREEEPGWGGFGECVWSDYQFWPTEAINQ